MIIGYARVSTADQNLDRQKDALLPIKRASVFQSEADHINYRRNKEDIVKRAADDYIGSEYYRASDDGKLLVIKVMKRVRPSHKDRCKGQKE